MALLVASALPASAQEDSTWRSRLYPGDWTPDHQTAEGHFLHDFSYAGYHKGERPIPDQPRGETVNVIAAPFNADPTGGADSTAAIQQAIDHVTKRGGGIVYLPAGTYRVKPPKKGVDAALRISASHLVLRGAGPDKTFLFNDEPVMRNQRVVRLRPDPRPKRFETNWYRDQEGDAIPVAADVQNRATQIRLASVDGLNVGDWIVLRTDTTEAFVREAAWDWLVEHWVGKLAPRDGIAFYRQITSRDVASRTIDLDIPVRYWMKRRDNARVYRVPPHLEEVGIENLSIGMREHPGTDGWGFNDYQTEGKSAHDVHNSFAVQMNHVVNGWIRNVHTYRPPVNRGPHHLVSNAFALGFTRNVSVIGCDLRQAQYRGGGGNGYGYVLEGSDNLIQDCFGEELRYVYDFKSMMTTGNVVHRSESRSRSDFHMHLSVANLLDNLHMNGEYFYAGTRYDWGGPAHGKSTDQTVFWNLRGTGSHKEHDHVIDIKDQTDAVFVIGTQGERTTAHNVDGTHKDRIEGIGKGATLQPQSLYEDQLQRRLQRGPAKVAN
jgi:hypothetical protein